MIVSANRFVRQQESSVRRSDREDRQAKRISLSASNCKPILDSEEGEMNMALDGKNNVKLTPLVGCFSEGFIN